MPRRKVGYGRKTTKARPKKYATSVRRDFRRAVNMSPARLRRWLASPESKKVGFRRPGARESVGHASGRKITKMLARGGKFDAKHARKVVGYVRRHLAQRPAGNVAETRWRYSLMNWGHDPLGAK
jgi:hypothetical protein